MTPAAQTRSVLVVGAVHVDVLRRGPDEWRRTGQGTATLATALSRHGEKVTLLTTLGADNDGLLLLYDLLDADVTVPARCLSALTTSTITSTTHGGLTTQSVDVTARLPRIPTPATDALLVTSNCAFAEPTAEYLRALCTQARSLGQQVFFDARVTPGTLIDHAEALRSFEQLAALADATTLSRKDAFWLYPGKRPIDVARHVASLGTGLTVLTRSSRGPILAAGPYLIRLQGQQIHEQSGADAFTAALVHHTLGQNLRQLTGHDVAEIAASYRRAGALFLPHRRGENSDLAADAAAS